MTAAVLWADVAALYATYNRRVYNYVNRKVAKPGSSNELAEDLTAEVFLKAIEAMCAGHGPTSSVSGWLFRIAHNLVIDEYNRRSKRAATIDFDALAELPVSGLTPHEQAVSAAGCEHIWRCIGRLKDEQAQAIVLHVEGCDDPELAARIGIHLEAAKGRLHRGRLRLAKLLTQEGIAP